MSGIGSSSESYDVVVLGLGGMGSAALYHLARRGVSVCGIDRFGLAHDRGSSHGETRIIRKAYFEHPDYVPLLDRAYALWRELEAESGARLLVESGLLLAARPHSPTVEGLERCYRAHALPHYRLTSAQACLCYPQFRLPEDMQCFYDPQGGYLYVESCVQQHLALAQRQGARIRLDEPVLSWEAGEDSVRVTTASRTIEAGRLVIAAGPWAQRVVSDLGAPLQLLRKIQLWYDTPGLTDYRLGYFPAYFVETDYGAFYGYPAIGPAGIKVAEHTGGEPFDDPDALDRTLRPGDEANVLRFLGETFPRMKPHLTRHSACMYAMSPDSHFLIGLHPGHKAVAVASGLSGHGFKFASVVGEVMADLALEGRTRHPIEFLRPERFK